ncbi:MAG: efflux RND transporter permease subunit, partial [Myxococcota bacterium]
ATGATTCDGGAVSDSCQPGSPLGADTTCDGVDDDCDGRIDEAFVSQGTTCGLGACAATGATSCVDGAIVDSCETGAPVGADATCDGIDDDCDGATDEAFVATTTSCGVGVCTATGTTSCSAGVVSDSCTEGAPTGPDATCDGLDADCDGSVDEAFIPTATACGQGVCAATGITQCVAGTAVDSCSPGAPSGPDTLCDNLDADCDGAVDEAFVGQPTVCGEGVCASAGLQLCEVGTVRDTCEPSLPTGADSICDGQDADCDGLVDESFVAGCQGSATEACVAGAIELTECDDGDLCTGDESCDAGACLMGIPPTIDDGNPCTADACDPVLGVTNAPLADGTDCGNGDVCDGAETCQAGACAPGTPLTIDDGFPCTVDSCDPITGVRNDPLPVGTSCDDGNPCNGIELCSEEGFCLPGTPPISGPCVPAAPVARFFVPHELDLAQPGAGTTFGPFTCSSTGPRFGPAGRKGIDFACNQGAGTTGEFIVALASQQFGAPPLIDRIVVDTDGISALARRLEIAVSTSGTDPDDFVVIADQFLDFERANDEIAFAQVPARYVRVRAFENATGTRTQVRALRIFAAGRSGDWLSLSEAGATATTPPSSSPSEFIHDGRQTGSVWTSADASLPQAFTLDLAPELPALVDAVSFAVDDFTDNIEDFEVLVSATGAEADFVPVATGRAERLDDRRHWAFFPPVQARSVRVIVQTNHGQSRTRVSDIKVHSAQRGGLTAHFQNASLAGGDAIEHIFWDFGDGTFAIEDSPQHTFPGPGIYPVTLRVIGEYGSQDSITLPYIALDGPEAFFDFDPRTIIAGQQADVVDGSLPGTDPFGVEAPIVERRYVDFEGEESAFFGTTGSFLSSYGPRDGGDFPLTLTVRNSNGLADTFADVLTVANVAPTAETGDDQRVVYLRDVAEITLGADSYDWSSRLSQTLPDGQKKVGQAAAMYGIYQLPGSNALATAEGVKAALDELAVDFPDGIAYTVAFDFTD